MIFDRSQGFTHSLAENYLLFVLFLLLLERGRVAVGRWFGI